MSQPTTDFLAFVKNLLPADKYKMFLTLFRYPVKTNEVTGTCFDRLSKIFDGRNPAFNYQFLEAEQREDWEYYRTNVLNSAEVWRTKGWEYFKTEINSVLIVDLKPVQGSEMPEPYFYWLKIDDVIDYKLKCSSGLMEWIIFKQPGKKIAVIDDESYKVYNIADSGELGSLEIESHHDLGYCPARFFWSESLSLCNPDLRLSPVTKELEALDWFLFYHISKRNLDLYGAYPIYSGYEQSCNFSNEENGDECDGGFLRNSSGFYKIDQAGTLQKCPKCGDKRIVGVGSFVEIPIPDGDKQPDLRNPVSVLTVDRDSLDYNVEEEQRLKADIIAAIVGRDATITATTAINKTQVEANYEAQSTILNRVKKNFELAQQFVEETICKLRYGEGFVSAKINYGTDFYILDAQELRERYKTSKEGGASESELDALQNQIIETEYRNNPTQLQRMLILAELEPYRHLTRDEILAMFEKQMITAQEVKQKLNFTSFIRRFERENTNVLEFGSAIPYSRKIEIINKKLKDYAAENENVVS